MAGFYGCLKIPDDPTMAESLNEASGNLEVLEASDEGKKKSKFKAFKKIFGKKKKKEPEDAQGGRSLNPSLSNSSINNSSLNLAQEDQQPKSRVKRRMGNKSLSHDSIFMLELEPERSESKTYPSPEPQRGRSLERAHVSRTLPITGSMPRAVSGGLFEVMPHYVQRSGIWVAGSKITEIPPLRPRQPSVSPTHTGSDTISKDIEEISADDESPKTPQKKALPQKMLTVEKIPPRCPRQPSVSPTRTGSDTISKDSEEISGDDESPKTPQKKALQKKMLTMEKIPPRRPHQPSVSPTRTGSDTVSKDFEEISGDDESPKTPQKKALQKKMLTMEKSPPLRPRQPSVSPTSTGSDTISKDFEEISDDDESPTTPEKRALLKKMFTMEKEENNGDFDGRQGYEDLKAKISKIPPRRLRQPSISPPRTRSGTVSKDFEEISGDDESPKTPKKKALPKKMLTMEKIPPRRPCQPSISQPRTRSGTVSKDFEEISADDESPKTPPEKALPKKMLSLKKIPPRRPRQPSISPPRTRSGKVCKDFEEISGDDESPKTPQKKALPKKMLTMEKIPPRRPRQPSISPPRTRSGKVCKDFEEISGDDESPKTPQKKAIPKKMLTMEKIPPLLSHQPSFSPPRTRSDTVSKEFEEISADDESPKTPPEKALPKKMLSMKKEENNGDFDGCQASADLTAKLSKIPPLLSHQPSFSPPRTRSDTVSKEFEEISADDESPKTPPEKALPKKMLSMKKEENNGDFDGCQASADLTAKISKIPPLRLHQPSISLHRTRSDTVSKEFEEISADDESPKTPPEKALPKKMLSVKKEENNGDFDGTQTSAELNAKISKIPPLRPHQPSISPHRTRSDTVSKDFEEISADDESPKTPLEKALPKKMSVKKEENNGDFDGTQTSAELNAKISKIPPLRPRQPSISPPRTRSHTVSKDFEEISADDESPKTPPERALPKKMLSMKKEENNRDFDGRQSSADLNAKISKIPPLRPHQPSISPPRTRSDTVSKDFEEISADDESPKTPPEKALPKKMLSVKKEENNGDFDGSQTSADLNAKISKEENNGDFDGSQSSAYFNAKISKIPPLRPRQPSISPTHTGSDTTSKDFEEISADDESPKILQKKALPKKNLTMEKIRPRRSRQPSISPTRTGSDTISKDFEEISDDDESPTTAQKRALIKKMFTVEKIPPLRPSQANISPRRTRSDTVSKDFEEISGDDESPTAEQKRALLKKMFTVEKIPPLRPHHPSINPTRTGSDTTSKDFEEISDDDESSKTPQKKALPQKMLTIRKSSFEPSSRPIRAQSFTTLAMLTSPSSPQLPTGFSIPATTQGCLDSSAARHKMALNPRKQKKNLQATVKPEQEEPSLLKPLVSEDKSKTKPKAADQKKFKKESAGPSSQEESDETEIYKTTDQASNTDAAVSQAHSWPAAYGRRRGKKESSALVKSECGPRGRSPKQSSRGLGLNNRAGYPPADNIARSSPVWHLSLEKQVMEQPRAPQVETATPQELLSDKSDMGRRKAGLDFKARKASVSHSIPKDMEESMASGPSQYHEDGASGTKKSEARDSLLSVVKSPSTTQEDVMFSVTEEAQVCIDPYLQSEEEDSSSFDSQSTQFKIESAQDISTICKEKPPGNVLQAFTASDLAEGGISVERLPPRSISQSLGKLEAEDVSSDSDSTSEVESGSEQQLAPRYTFQSSRKPKDEEFSDSESASSEEGSGSKQQLDPKYSFQSLRKPKDDQEAFVKSSSFVGKLSSSHEQQAPRCASQALGEPEDKVSTESNSYLEKYNIAKDWSSSEEDMPQRHPSLTLGKSTDQQEISSVSKNTLEEWGVSVDQIPPRHLPQPFVRPLVQQQLSSGSMSVSSEWVPMPPRHLFQPWLSPKSEQQASGGPESTAFEWGIFLEPLPPRMPSRRFMRHKAEQKISSGPEIATVEGITSMELQPSRNSQPPVKRIAEQTTSAGPESTAVKRSISMEPLPPKVVAQPLMNPVVEQKVFLGSEGAEKVISVEPTFPEYCPQCLTNPQDQHILSEYTASNEDMFVELPPQKCPCQPLVRRKFQPQTISCDPQSASTEWSSPVELMPPRHTFSPWVSTSFEQQSSAGPESTAAEWGIPMEPLPPRMPSQPLMRPVAEQEVFSGSMNAPTEWSGLVEPMPPRYTFQPWVSPEFEQQAYAGPESAVAERSISMEPLLPRKPSQPLMKTVVKQPISTGPKSVAIEGDTSTEQLPPRHWSIVRQKVQQMMPSFEKAAVGCVSGRRLPPEYPIHFSIKSKVQEISSHLENTAVEGGTSKKSQHPRCPSQSFVKFMAQHIFSESPDMEEQVYADHPSSNQPSKSLVRPNVEHQVFSGWESADIEGGISSKLMPTKSTLQSLERPEEDPQEVFSYSQNAPVKCSCPQEQLPPRYRSQAWGKLEYEQEVSSVSESSLEEWKCSEEHLPSKCPFQAEGGAEFQPQIFSTGSVGVPVEWSSAEAHLPPRHPFQALADPGCQQQVYSSSLSAAAKGTISESNPSSWSLPRGPASPSKTGKRSQGSEDPIKNIPTPTAKPVKFTITPAWPTSTSGDTYSKVEVLESRDRNSGNSNLSTREADVENLFGVRLRKIPSSQKYKNKEQNYFTKLPSLSLGQISSSVGKPQIRSASQGHLGIAENRTTTSDVAEKQQSKPKSDSVPKKQPDYKIPGKAPGHQFDYATSEPAWITMAKQKQRNFPTQVPMKELKIKNRVGAKANTTVPRYEGADLAHQNQQRKISTSNVNRQEKMAQRILPTSTKAGFENQKIFQVLATRKETRQSSAHPAMFQGPVEPVWFSMAKKKAKAWSHITETMQ